MDQEDKRSTENIRQVVSETATRRHHRAYANVTIIEFTTIMPNKYIRK
ncbi:unnamed protein product [Acanthoscelides obtectus]|uniref:Uncharacterized protein n=1 Tax=Acanthoscelides obtectus TaxID=200917 RepID=A0A9P0NYY9_ACAOB|nr:unnamed protein product [Acanthoscelides obtectus]CAK1660331.1 hypothetical protein AOBTE_LOCUS22000 [Acanthoscelides obtectus]